jgi:Icc protein
MRWMLIALLALGGCMDVAEERALREDAIGQSHQEGVDVSVAEGLASIRHLDATRLELWANAPRLTIDLQFATPPASFTVLIQNLPPDAAASAQPPLPLDAAVVDVPTARRWTFAPGSSVHLVVEPPDAVTSGPFRFVALADVQEAIDEVQDIFRLINAEAGVRFVVFDGDLTQAGTAAQLQRFQRESAALAMPLYATLGNHELGTRPPAYHQVVGRGSFSFQFRGVQFTLLDSASATLAPTTYRRLAGWLDQGRDRLHVIGMHIPPLDPVGTRNGSFASRAEAARLLALFAEAGVDLTLYGHIHSYYSFFNAGIPAFISGGGGAVPERFDGIRRHFLVIDADPAAGTLTSRVVRVD